MAKTKKHPAQVGGDDKRMILDADLWPSWPFLPLKRRNNSLKDKNLGVLLCTQEHVDAIKGTGKFVVYHVYMFSPPGDKAGWDAAPRTEYDNVDALLADGWMVD